MNHVMPLGGKTWMPPISRSLQILAAVLFVAIVGVTGQQLMHSRTAMIDNALGQMARFDMVLAEQTGRTVETVDLILRDSIDAVRVFEPLGTVHPAEVDVWLLRRIEGVRQVAQIAISDPSGRVVYSSVRGAEPIPAPGGAGQGPAPAVFLPPAGQTLLAYHASHPVDELQISEPLRLGGNRWATLMSRRITDSNGRFAGIAIAYLNLQYFEDFYRAVELSENGAIVLHRRDGVVLARYPHDDKAVGTSFAELPPFKQVLARDIAGTVVMESPIDGTSRVLAIRALRLFPLAVSVSVSQESVLSPWRRQTATFAAAALVGSIALGTLLLLLARRSHEVETLVGEFRTAKESAEQANLRLLEQMDERERAEAALRQAQRIEAVGQMTGGVAHDFNNLLTVLLGNIDLLQQSSVKDHPDLADRLVRMRAAAERGAALTDQLLAFARRQPLIPRATDLNAVVEAMSDLLQSAIGSTVRLELKLGLELWAAMVDPTQIELVILNFAINARDAMPMGGLLTIETENVHLARSDRPEDPLEGDYVMIAVADTGTGMSADVQAKAFEPFFTTKGPGRGSGLGLSQVFGLARQSGGGVGLESVGGEGTIVRVYLPRAEHAAEIVDRSSNADISTEGSRATILLVDDDEAVRTTTAMILETMGYSVREYDNGKDALAALTTSTGVDILLTDVAMPAMSGPELARQVRIMRPDLPIVFFSGYADPEAVAGDIIRQRIVRKPFRAADLAAQIEAALTESRAT